MKCPKCAYNSFESYDTCRKCGNDLTAFKGSHGIRPLVFPPGPASAAFAETVAESAPNAAGEEFVWDTPVPSAAAAAPQPAADSFDFDFSTSAESPQSPEDSGFSFDDFGSDTAGSEAPGGGPQEFSFDDFSGDEREQQGAKQEMDLSMEGFSFDDEEDNR